MKKVLLNIIDNEIPILCGYSHVKFTYFFPILGRLTLLTLLQEQKSHFFDIFIRGFHKKIWCNDISK